MFVNDIEELKLKLLQLCESNELEMEIQSDTFPITFKFERIQTSIGVDEIDEIPHIQFTYGYAVDVDVRGNIALDAGDLNKISSLTKKLHYLYLQQWFYRKDDRMQQEVKRLARENITPMYATTYAGVVCLVQEPVAQLVGDQYV